MTFCRNYMHGLRVEKELPPSPDAQGTNPPE